MLPFLKNRDDGVSVGQVNTERRKPDETAEYGTIDAVAEDLLAAMEKKDKSLMKQALESLCDYIREEDETQDKEIMED